MASVMKRDPRLQVHQPQREARHVEQRAFAHRGEDQAQDRHHQRLGDLPRAREGRDGRKAHDHQREVFGGVEQERHGRQRRREDHQEDRADRAARETRHRRDGQRLARLPLLRHRVAVETGRDRPRDPRRVQQDRGGRAPEDRAVIDACQQDQRRRRIAQRDRHRDHDGDDRHRPQPRQHPDEGPDQAARDDHQEVLDRKGGLEADHDAFEHGSDSP
jgi:hypothetical protein